MSWCRKGYCCPWYDRHRFRKMVRVSFIYIYFFLSTIIYFIFWFFTRYQFFVDPTAREKIFLIQNILNRSLFRIFYGNFFYHCFSWAIIFFHCMKRGNLRILEYWNFHACQTDISVYLARRKQYPPFRQTGQETRNRLLGCRQLATQYKIVIAFCSRYVVDVNSISPIATSYVASKWRD